MADPIEKFAAYAAFNLSLITANVIPAIVALFSGCSLAYVLFCAILFNTWVLWYATRD